MTLAPSTKHRQKFVRSMAVVIVAVAAVAIAAAAAAATLGASAPPAASRATAATTAPPAPTLPLIRRRIVPDPAVLPRCAASSNRRAIAQLQRSRGGGVRSCVHQPAAGGHVEAARCGKSTPEATRRGSKRAAATREGGCVHTRPRPGPLFTTRPRLAVRTELTLCALARRLPTHQWVLSRSNFTPARVGTVASELGRAAVPQGTFQADGQARRQPAESGEATCMERLSRWAF